MHDIAGLVALAVMGLWIAYLVPHLLRYRQQLLESRTEDRFSDALRVLAVSDPRRGLRARPARAECGPGDPKRSGLLSPARGVPVGGRPAVTEERGGAVERPYATRDKISADDARRAAQQRAQRAAALARRAAAARRRALLTGVLLGLSVVAWVVVGLTPAAAVVGVVPTVLLGGVLALGRRAATAGRRADEVWERRQRAASARAAGERPRVTGRAQHPSQDHTEVIAQVGGPVRPAAGTAGTAGTAAVGADPTATRADESDADGSASAVTADGADPAVEDGVGPAGAQDTTDAADAGSLSSREATESPAEGWSPVPVPRPTYTTKATAPRREPLPLVVEAASAADAAATVRAAADADDAEAPALDLDAILARRRAAGE